jgi:glycosyltransferase involved in cell wall biosynthesis
MKVTFCWTVISGYIAACWRELAARPGIDLRIIAAAPQGNAPYSREITAGLPIDLVPYDSLTNPGAIADAVVAQKPDVVVVSGWAVPAHRALTRAPALADARFVMTMDTPYRRLLRQHVGRFRHTPFFRRVSRAVVAGERSWQLARVLGFPESRIRRALYAIDFQSFASAMDARVARGVWPRRWLYIGRYVDDKAIDTLVEGYRRYRASVTDPWPLTTCGTGPLAHLLKDQPGIEDRGFVQPAELPAVLADAGAFVIASRFEPWGQVIVEAAAAGLPLVCSESCGAAPEMVRSYYNGQLFPTDDPAALARALAWLHTRAGSAPDEALAMARRSQRFAEPYSAQMWADRWVDLLGEVMDEPIPR